VTASLGYYFAGRNEKPKTDRREYQVVLAESVFGGAGFLVNGERRESNVGVVQRENEDGKFTIEEG
jgi:hypothetical protein